MTEDRIVSHFYDRFSIVIASFLFFNYFFLRYMKLFLSSQIEFSILWHDFPLLWFFLFSSSRDCRDYCGLKKFLKLGQDLNLNFVFTSIDIPCRYYEKINWKNWKFIEKLDGFFLFLFSGGIFHEDNYNSEVAFRYAIDRVNLMEKNFELVPVVHKVTNTDSYKTERIGW